MVGEKRIYMGFKGINANSREDDFRCAIPAKAGIQV
jgi:hypothetical protein